MSRVRKRKRVEQEERRSACACAFLCGGAEVWAGAVGGDENIIVPRVLARELASVCTRPTALLRVGDRRAEKASEGPGLDARDEL